MERVPDLRYGFAPRPPAAPGFDPAGDAAAIVLPGPSPATEPVPGVQLEGRLATGGRFVLRIPDDWNGRLIAAGTPALRSAWANDGVWGELALARGYAFASSDKAIPVNVIVEPIAGSPDPEALYPVPFDLFGLASKGIGVRIGVLETAGGGIAAWNDDFAALVVEARTLVERERGARVERVYAVGLSNGGAQVRALLERHPELVDGGLEVAAPYWTPEHSFLDELPLFLEAMPGYVASGFTDAAAAAAIVAAGYPPDRRQDDPAHPSLWFEHYAGQPSFYDDISLFAYALLIDPEASACAGPVTPNPVDPMRLPGTCAGRGLARPEERRRYRPSPAARRAIGAFAHTGAIGKPLLSVAGDCDILLPPAHHALGYRDAVAAAGRAALFRQSIVAGGTHVDTFSAFGYGLQPQLPHAWAAFDRLVDWVEDGVVPA